MSWEEKKNRLDFVDLVVGTYWLILSTIVCETQDLIRSMTTVIIVLLQKKFLCKIISKGDDKKN